MSYYFQQQPLNGPPQGQIIQIPAPQPSQAVVMGPPPSFQYVGQPANWGGGGGVRPRGGKNSSSLVPRIKSEVSVARPGQLLDILRMGAAKLSQDSPELYAQFLAGLGVKPGAQHQEVATPPQVEQLKQAATDVPALIAKRKALWKQRCSESQAVSYWQQVQDDFRKKDASVSVDDAILTDEHVLVREYHKGKAMREQLLAECGLRRTPSGFELLPGFTEQAPKSGVESKEDGVSHPSSSQPHNQVTSQTSQPGLPQDEAALTSLITKLLRKSLRAMQKESQDQSASSANEEDATSGK